MGKAETLKRQIDVLPPAMLGEVEQFIKKLKDRRVTMLKKATILSELAAFAIDDDLPTDLAEQHDHYLYGVPKK